MSRRGRHEGRRRYRLLPSRPRHTVEAVFRAWLAAGRPPLRLVPPVSCAPECACHPEAAETRRYVHPYEIRSAA
ncbi:hypothetical protein GCM10009555_018200 [Acrocarpospora macrocephala]|uniref:Uncharacterized protein n=1 Tax=Acrocarpospora macrocephala TaxID=150177 RepID=A0A5M3WGQ8_9ACTN|nr:hypothetical protein [Acrocarpospora macrocephala]GES07480.1 hypothetical protein Amac_010750 [Acrocarpospora macrocephala]